MPKNPVHFLPTQCVIAGRFMGARLQPSVHSVCTVLPRSGINPCGRVRTILVLSASPQRQSRPLPIQFGRLLNTAPLPPFSRWRRQPVPDLRRAPNDVPESPLHPRSSPMGTRVSLHKVQSPRNPIQDPPRCRSPIWRIRDQGPSSPGSQWGCSSDTEARVRSESAPQSGTVHRGSPDAGGLTR
ncbi:hypothetical protein NDU88_006069 [Pleurodeles waltl]|uniref:Uncharacterized protein n=1 Tax=Pleurodeles waltl TaxID=8319 RepID=A0AAV7WDM4_PLEWA|nr:hypothetical protein NDU88_006069 [Pleurodeles waltl]